MAKTSKVKTHSCSLSAVIRVLSLGGFLYTTVTISLSWISLMTFLILIGSIYLLDNADRPFIEGAQLNPLKGKPKAPVLSKDRRAEVALSIKDFVCYDAEKSTVMEKFNPIKLGTECIFAKKAKLWSSKDWDMNLSLEENVYRCAPTFLEFTILCQELGLDGFVFLLPGDKFGSDPQGFGQGVRRVLQTLSDLDPAKVHCMNKSYMDKKGWIFEFNSVTMFITTFAPFYPASSSRYAFESEDCFIVFQPEISFAQHDLPTDTPHTNWINPETVRDRIRIAFQKAGRGYTIRETIFYPVAHDIVKPMNEGEPLIEWWKKTPAYD